MTMPSTDPQTQPTTSPSRRLSRWPVTLAAALLLALTALTYPAATASATSIDAHCVGTFTRTFSPPVTSTPQSVTVTGTFDYTTCLIGSTATGTETDTVTLSCIPATTAAITETLTWNDTTSPPTSTITWSGATAIGQTVVYTGTVTAGRHTGDTATKITSGISYVGALLPCLLGTTPVSSATGLVDSLLLTH
jgi:hypothetical protein